jgi:polysaccharide export outer membrane protein
LALWSLLPWGFDAGAPQSPASPAAAQAPQLQSPQAPAPSPAGQGAGAPPATTPASAASPAGEDTSKAGGAKPAPGTAIEGTVAVDPNTYRVGPEDELAVSVFGEAELSGGVRVRPDGIITLAIIGEVKAAGLTLVELSKVITDDLAKTAIKDPIVSVGLVAPHSKKYYLYGQFKMGGEKELIMPTTVLEAIVSAGGFVDFAKKSNITIVRGNQRFKFNFDDVIKGKHLEQNIYLQPGDIIYVR